MQVKKQQLELGIEQQTGSKSERFQIKAVYCHPAYLPYTQNASCKMPGWMNHKLENSSKDGNTRPPYLRNLNAGEEATVRTRHKTTDWFKIVKRLRQGCVLSLCLFNM